MWERSTETHTSPSREAAASISSPYAPAASSAATGSVTSSPNASRLTASPRSQQAAGDAARLVERLPGDVPASPAVRQPAPARDGADHRLEALAHREPERDRSRDAHRSILADPGGSGILTRCTRPWNAFEAPRFTGPRTYARLPYVKDLAGVDAAVFGLPWDGVDLVPLGRPVRAGGRAVGVGDDPHLQPRARACRCSASCRRSTTATRPRRPATWRDAGADGGASSRPIAESPAVPIGIGGDHLVTLAELRALAKVHGPLGLVHLDSHTDLWDAYNGLPYAHGTMFQRAIEEGVLDPARMIQLGMRGPLYGEDDEAIPGDARRRDDRRGWSSPRWPRPRCWSASGRGSATARRSARSTSTSSTRRSRPGTGTPEVGGPSSYEALQIYRALARDPVRRLRRRRGRPAVRRPGPGDGPAGVDGGVRGAVPDRPPATMNPRRGFRVPRL